MSVGRQLGCFEELSISWAVFEELSYHTNTKQYHGTYNNTQHNKTHNKPSNDKITKEGDDTGSSAAVSTAMTKQQ